MIHVVLDQKSLGQFKKSYSKHIEFIEPNYIYTIPKLIPEESLGGDLGDIMNLPSGQWGLNKTPGVNAEKAWTITQGRKDTIVAVIDTGVDYKHYALKNSMWVNKKEKLDGKDTDGNGYIDDIHGFNFVNRSGDPSDDHNHGTHCAGIIAADSDNLKGIAPKASIMAVKFLDNRGRGTLANSIEAIEYAVDNGADVLNISWGSNTPAKGLEEAVKYAEKHGVLFVAAAGNDRSDNDITPTYPANYNVKNVIAVAAHNLEGKKAYFSNYGKMSIDLFAPGQHILSSIRNSRTKIYSGTSMAAPFVAGAAALFISEYGHVPYSITKNAILNNVVQTYLLQKYVKTEGRLDAYKMLLNKN
jgi:subtilisin family serine protease